LFTCDDQFRHDVTTIQGVATTTPFVSR
jgi:hypothetical protein